MKPNLAVSIYVRSSIKCLHFVPFHQQIWPPRAILVSDWLLFKKIFSSETTWQNGAKLVRKHLCKILYKASSFGSIRRANMAAKINSFFWLANVKKIFSSESAWQNGAKLVRKHLCKILYKASSFGFIRRANMAAKINSFFWLANVKKIFSSETAWPNGAKLGIDGPWVCPFQNCVRQPHPPFKMAAVF